MKKSFRISSLITLLLILNSTLTIAQDRINGKSFTTRSEVIAQNGMVATSHPLVTQIGLDILKNGGMVCGTRKMMIESICKKVHRIMLDGNY